MKKIYLLMLFYVSFTSIRAQNFKWVKREGWGAHDLGYGVTTDTSGNVYLAGKYEMNANFSDSILPQQGNHDIFLAKYTPSGKLTWIRTAGSYSGDYARTIACDGTNYVYIGGEIQGTGAVIKFVGSPIQLTSVGNNDMFIAKYDLNGTLIWARSAGGTNVDETIGVTYDAEGNVYACGFFNTNITFGTTVLNGSGGYDMFVTKYDANGNLKWAKKIGSSGKDDAKSIKCDASGNVYVCGSFQGTVSFGTLTSQRLTSPNGRSDGFLAKYDPNGTIIWVKRMGGNSDDVAWSIAMDNAGKIYVSGEFSSNSQFGSISLTSSGSMDVFVACYDVSGNALWAKRAGGGGEDRARAIGSDGTNLYITGQYGSTTASFGSTTLHAVDLLDVYMAKLDNAGNFKWATAVGGPPDVNEIYGFEAGLSICAEPSGNIYAAGAIVEGGVFGNITINKYDHSDVFLAKMEDSVTASICKIPTGLFADSITATSAKLSWTGTSNATSYNVQYRKTGTSSWTTLNTNISSIVISGLTALSSYEFQIKTICPSNVNNYSPTATFTTIGTGATALIPVSSSWKYLDNGTDQGSAWKGVSFNDSTWKTGNAELGYGDGDENTVVAFGPDPANRYITTYFRKKFTVDLLSNYSSFDINLLKDDGAVVYINGVEVIRKNLPTGPILYTTLATASLGNPEEAAFTHYIITPSNFVTGTNTIAVEVHQSYGSSPDMSFNLLLTANSWLGVCGIPTNLNATALMQNSATLSWTAVTNALNYDVQYRKTGTIPWTTINTNTNSITISGLTASSGYEFQVRTVCSSSTSIYSSTATFTTTGTGITGLIPAGSSWKYLDNGTNQGSAWKESSFNDSTWKTGNAELGYGDGDEATVVGFGPDPANRYITTYFRKTFTIDSLANYSSFDISLLKDDGALVYINGVEVIRTNMPTGIVSYGSLATASIGLPEEAIFTNYIINSSNFVTGVNTIAVEVHQSYGGSSDKSFNLTLTANSSLGFCGIPTNLSAASVMQNSATLNWTAVTNALSYDVQYRNTGTTSWTTINTNTNLIAISGLTASSNYEFQVRTVCSSSTSIYSSTATFTTTGTGISGLIPAGSSWKYLDNGTNQGSAWKGLPFNDSTWKTGNAELGYGDGDENTVVGFGPDAANRYITTYFRKTFTIDLLSNYSSFDLSLLKDDGAIVYINGVEVVRTNMPAGSVSYTTLATASIGLPEEATFTHYIINPSNFVTGVNTIAVEVHQSYGSSPDLSFNLTLTAASVPVAICEVPISLNAVAILQNSATLKWTAVTGAISYDVQYRIVGTTSWTTISTSMDSIAISGLTASSNYEFQVRTVCSSSTSSYSSTATFTTAGIGITELIPSGASWKYLDNGSNEGTTWRTTSYNDITWQTGNAEFGYGDADETTLVSYGASSTNKYITTYFRKTFNVVDVATVSGLALSLIRDDGAVIYINGVEVYRSNLPAGTIYFNTLAPTYIDGISESTYVVANISSASLVNGSNLIAVEIHQNAVTSSDISFNLKLNALNGLKMLETFPISDNHQQTNILENSYDMIVSPNPTTGKFNLELCVDNLAEKTLIVEVSNSFGQVIYKKQPKKINACVNEVIELDSSLPIGVYIMKVSVDNKIETTKMLLAR